MQQTSLEDQARTLEATGAYRVLRRIAPLPLETLVPRDQTRVGLFLDLETTGLDPACHEIIEFGMVPFVYTLDGRILGTLPAFNRLREPCGHECMSAAVVSCCHPSPVFQLYEHVFDQMALFI